MRHAAGKTLAGCRMSGSVAGSRPCGADNLAENPPVQSPLPFGRADTAALDTAVDRVRDTFGPTAVTRTALLGREAGEVPMLPD